MGKKLKLAEAQAGRLADEVARLNAKLERARQEKVEHLERGIADLYNHSGQRLTLITPGGFLIGGIVLNLTEEVDEVYGRAGRRSAELRIALTP
jgi:hypothetical protein